MKKKKEKKIEKKGKKKKKKKKIVSRIDLCYSIQERTHQPQLSHDLSSLFPVLLPRTRAVAFFVASCIRI